MRVLYFCENCNGCIKVFKLIFFFQVSLPLSKAMEMVPFRLMKPKLFPRPEESTTMGTAQFPLDGLWLHWFR